MSPNERGRDRADEQHSVLDALLAERDGLLSVLDRVVALNGTARLIRESSGAESSFVGDLETADRAVIRWMSGTRTDALQDLVVHLGRGMGGRVLAMGRPVQVDDYLSASTITHDYDAQVRGEGLGGMVAVPILSDEPGRPIRAIAYAALRSPGRFGDRAVGAVEAVAAEAARALKLAGLAESGRRTAVDAERRRMQTALHDSVGAMLFSIGAQVRDLHTDMRDNPGLLGRLTRLEADVSAASLALRESLLALSASSPERALPVELAEHCRSFEARSGVPARFVQLGQVEPLDAERTALLVGAVREGLLNAEKHAGAGAVVVSLGPADGGVRVAVADDGGDPDPGPEGAGIGIRTLVERAARLGGQVSLVRDEDGGTTLRTWVPDPRRADGSDGSGRR